jgi:hypothetical protein
MPGKRYYFVFALCASALFGQSAKQTFFFPEIETPQTLQEFVNTIRSIGEIRETTFSWQNKSITVQGTADQVSLAAWLAQELAAAPATRPALIRRDYPGPVADDQLVQVFFLAHTQTPQDLQELVNATRSTADIQRFFPCNAIASIVARGTRDQIDMAGWVINALDQPADALKPGHQEHSFPSDPRAGVAQLYFLASTDSPRGIQEIVNGTRSLADIQRCFPYNSRKVLLMRGTGDQIAFADWVLGLLDRPASSAADMTMHEYKVNTGYARDTATIARVFFLNHTENPQEIQQVVNDVRTATSMQRIFPNNQAKAIAMRGTGDQISRAEQMLKDK